MKRALITGITGQDGSYLAEYLVEQGYEVFGLIRGQNNPKRPLVEAQSPEVRLIEGDLMDQPSLIKAVQTVQPDEVYNLGAISYVPMSWAQPELTGGITGMGALRLLEAIRVNTDASPSRSAAAAGIRFYQASSSEMFGKVRQTPQSEETPFHPRSPYGVAKTFAHYITMNYRESYNMFACSGILFNHESPRRGAEFVTRKITMAVARIAAGQQDELLMGNLDAKRDWGYAGDFVRAMHLMLQQPEPDDFVIGTGETHSVREFIELAFSYAGLVPERYVRVDPQFMRPAEVDLLLSDPRKARAVLGWRPDVSFEGLVQMMAEADLRRLGMGERDAGTKTLTVVNAPASANGHAPVTRAA
ncbi:MAG: GDP-mannose 4,6-dehydratase [Chloroflexi bacterium]|nr:GDP-mannose 4,6-dehydratase [Chloroflexota bacterium]